jgi:magnesium-transporting ATPase (P-type)
MDLVIAGERREAEYEWFRYSKIAFPFLLLILGITVALIGLTFQQGDVTLKRIRPGVPRDIEFNPKDQSTENGIPIGNRSLRIAAFIIAYVAIVLIVLVIYIRPAAKIRKFLYIGLAVILIIAGILAWIAFGVDADNVRDATKCNSRDVGSIQPTNRSPCQSAWAMAVAVTCFDAGLGFFSILTGLVLIYAAMRSVRKVPAGLGVDVPVEYGVSHTLRQLLLILLFFTFAAAVLLTVFTIVLHSGRDSYDENEAWQTRAFDALRPGWPLKNTRLRLAACGIIIITILLNLIPFRARVIAYIFGFLLLVGSVVVLIAFATDLRQMASAKQLICPTNFTCAYNKYVATIILDILVCFLIVVYILYEYVFRLAYDATHASRIVY